MSDEMKPTETKKVGWGGLVWLILGVVVVIVIIGIFVFMRLS
jgi:flagellar basal body-associated protein FliL